MYIYTNDLLIRRMNDFDLFFGESGYVRTDDSWKNDNARAPYTRLYYVDGGKARLTLEENVCILEPSHVYLIPAGLAYDYAGLPSVHKLYFHINIFKPDGFDLMLSFKDVGCLPYPDEQIGELKRLYESDRFSDTVLLKGYISDTVARMIRKYGIGKNDNESYSPLVQNAMRYIRANLSAGLGIAEVADSVFVSVSTLTKTFKEQTGRTVGAYIDDLVMYSAQRKLLRTDMSVSEVSEKLGFCDQFYFSRYFKRRCGESPLKYRKRMQTVDFGADTGIHLRQTKKI